MRLKKAPLLKSGKSMAGAMPSSQEFAVGDRTRRTSGEPEAVPADTPPALTPCTTQPPCGAPRLAESAKRSSLTAPLTGTSYSRTGLAATDSRPVVTGTQPHGQNSPLSVTRTH